MSGNPKMILPYEWILENVEEEPMTIASKMISFRGEKVFRVGLKNYAVDPVLFLVAIDLNKMGMMVLYVMYGIQGSGIGPATMEQMMKENIGDGGSLQLFTIKLAEKVVGNCTFSFRIVIEGTYGYSYQLSDRLAKDQLWATVKDNQWTDVEFIVKEKKISAHAAILAARSEVFAAEFEKKQPGRNGPQQIQIDGVEPSTVEKFLHFIYTGETMGTFADEGLHKLAAHYQLPILSGLCRVALKKIEATQMVKLIESINNGVDGVSRGVHSSKIMPEKDTEIFFDGTTPTFRCDLSFNGSQIGKPKCLMQYQKEDVFFAHFTGHRNGSIISKPGIHFSCAKHRKFGLKIEDVYFSCQPKPYKWFKMEAKMLKNSAEVLLHFTSNLEFDFNYNSNQSYFDIKTVSTIGNYYYEMMDDDWCKDLWAAATNKKFTDVQIYVGNIEVMEGHRVILSARSPVLNASLNKTSKPAEKSIVRFEAEFDVEVVKNFLNFLYTGRLESSASVHQLGKLATMYQVETLKNVCQVFNVSPPDAEELTNYLLEL
ncbi:uncharacterized protein LOC124205542 [Daphnia pulex]|uniref:uncharacterized protein LOC124205542 n=1 Tax=Daphnia pulex TaxID=6669 RepID=UPI001EDEC442|nr:uncharacterized protein LOC124205542 [Daphnia pulex]